jgi:hypothetical protein
VARKAVLGNSPGLLIDDYFRKAHSSVDGFLGCKGGQLPWSMRLFDAEEIPRPDRV